jgi:hypothetical protein
VDIALVVLVTARGADKAVPAAMATRERDLKETILNGVKKCVKLKEGVYRTEIFGIAEEKA